ncbi:hypothetical protein KIH74_06640 [Kineosporia sp. J2-2]|uniref:4,5-dihydroxyphthalate decarboxylase n=1 Tax=Kineosporia corallincola TaxID=2835133 RepID=A0ABS5TEE8_9ACTN|nr:hypothetical protein [Kineosporia corallincola]MBT0768596.1 hypothetical protein [Kineosporia corallincola]
MTADLRVVTGRYDTTRALFDGRVRLDHASVTTEPTLPDVFRRLVDGEADVAEFGLTFYLRSLDHGAPFVALPVFPVRLFRHSAVFVHADSDITGPEDLRGRTIGEFGVYGQDPGVWVKGILMDEYGFRPASNRWVVGGLDRPMPPFGFTTHPHPDDVEVVAAPPGETLSGLLETGRIEALFTANVPQPFLDGSPAVRRLFPDYEARERDYYRRTRIFPIMHVLAAPRDLLERRPGLARQVHAAFLEAKELGRQEYRDSARLYQAHHMMPWTNALFEENARMLPDDWWPYGISANRHVLDTFLRYHHEQGLSRRRWGVNEVFTPELLDT